jgi:hypothetical protein
LHVNPDYNRDNNLDSRTITVPFTSSSVIFRTFLPSHQAWKFIGITDQQILNITIEQLFANSQAKTELTVGQEGTEFIGSGSCVITAKNNTTSNIVFSAALTTPTINTYGFEYQEDVQVCANGVFSDIGGNGGFPRPFTNYLAIYANGNIDFQITNAAGSSVRFEANNIEPKTLLLNQFKTGSNLRYQIAGNGANRRITPIWYNKR